MVRFVVALALVIGRGAGAAPYTAHACVCVPPSIERNVDQADLIVVGGVAQDG